MGTTVAVIGASGRTGREVVRAAAARGDTVVAVVRDPARLTVGADRVAVADVRSVEQLAAGFDGVDAVLFCVGPVGADRSGVHGDGIAACLTAMRSAGVRRLVAVSASGFTVTGDDPLSHYLAKPLIGRLLRRAYVDMARMEERIRVSDTDWTILRPPRLVDGTGRGRYRSRRDGNVRWSYQITRADLARAVLDTLGDPTTIAATISVAG